MLVYINKKMWWIYNITHLKIKSANSVTAMFNYTVQCYYISLSEI